MSSIVFTIFMPAALGLVMFGLGLTLTVADFKRVLRYPKATAVALACQLVLLPVVCFGLVLAFELQGALAVGMMLLVAPRAASRQTCSAILPAAMSRLTSRSPRSTPCCPHSRCRSLWGWRR